MNSTNPQNANYGYQLAACLIVAGALRFGLLDAQSLWFDEGTTLELVSAPDFAAFLDRLIIPVSSERLTPAYFFLAYGWGKIFGIGDFALRALPALLGTAGVLILALAVRPVASRQYSVLVAAFGATSSYWIFYSQEARPYALALMMVALIFFVFIREIKAPDVAKGRIVIFAVISGIAILTSVFSALLLAALGAADLIIRRRPSRWIAFWAPAGLLSVAVFLAWMLQFEVGASAAVPKSGNFIYNLLFVPYSLLFGQTLGPPIAELRGDDKVAVALAYSPYLLLSLVSLFLVVASAAKIQRAQRFPNSETLAAAKIILLAAVISFGGAAILAYGIALNWLPRHAFFLEPVLIMLLPLALAAPAGSVQGSQKMTLLGRAACGLFIGLNLFSLSNYYFDTAYARDDYKAAAAYLRTEVKSGDTVALLYGKSELLKHYGVSGVLNLHHVAAEELGQALLTEAGKSQISYLVLNRSFYWHGGASVRDSLGEDFEIGPVQRFSYIDVYKVRAR